jgi:foldase protein PrsA
MLPLLLLAAIGALLAACGGNSGGTPDVPEDAVAVAGDKDVPLSAFETLINQQKLQYKQQKRPFPKVGTKDYNALRDQITAYLVHAAEFEQKADELDIKVTDKEIQDALKKFKQTQFGGDEKKYVQARNAQGLKESDVVDNERLQLITTKLFKHVTDSSKVTPKQIRAYYDKNKAQYVTQDSRTVRHILVPKKALADKIYSQLENGADFAKLAKKYSKDTGSAQQGGRLTISKGQTVPEFESTAFKLKTGQLAKPVKTQFGWHIIEAVSPVTKASFVPFAKVSAQIRQQLESTNKNTVMYKWVEGVQ